MAGRSQSKTSTDHDEIRQWAEARAGRPAVMKSTRGKQGDTGIPRIDFPGYSGSGSLEQILWEEFFEKFAREKLALMGQETTARGQKGSFNKIVSLETATERAARSPARKIRAPGKPRRENRPALKRLNTAREAGEMFLSSGDQPQRGMTDRVSTIDTAASD